MGFFRLFIAVVSCLFVVSITQAAASNSATPKPITDGRLNECYQKFPMFLSVLMEISDEDFANRYKARDRRRKYGEETAKDVEGVSLCLKDIKQYAVEMKDPENLQYMTLRLRDIDAAVKQVRYEKQSGDESGNTQQ